MSLRSDSRYAAQTDDGMAADDAQTDDGLSTDGAQTDDGLSTDGAQTDDGIEVGPGGGARGVTREEAMARLLKLGIPEATLHNLVQLPRKMYTRLAAQLSPTDASILRQLRRKQSNVIAAQRHRARRAQTVRRLERELALREQELHELLRRREVLRAMVLRAMVLRAQEDAGAQGDDAEDGATKFFRQVTTLWA